MRFLIFVLILMAPSLGLACSCEPMSDEEAYKRSLVVFLAKVVETKLISGQPFELVHAKFVVTEQFKGRQIKVETLESTASTTCATALIAGHQYLIYSNNKAVKHVNACTRSRWVNVVREKELLEQYRNER